MMQRQENTRTDAADMLNGLRVLIVFPPSRKDRAKSLMKIMTAAKERWGWQINGIVSEMERAPFVDLVAPNGQLFSRPHLLRVADWERDADAVRAVDAQIRETELRTNVPVGRVILAGAHSIGRAYNVPVRYANQYALIKKVLKDNAEPFRIFRRLFRFADHAIDSAKADLVIAIDWATALHFSVWMAANRRGIPCLAIRDSKIIHHQSYWTAERLLFNTLALEEAGARRNSGAAPSEAAMEKIKSFRDQPKTINWIATRWHHRARRNFIRWHLECVRIFAREFVHTLRGQDNALREPWGGRFFRYYRRLFLSYYHQRFMHVIDDESLAKMKYIYFPLHKEAELAQCFQASIWHDQRKTIRVLASSLPFGYRLLVREHRMNFGVRPTQIYRELAAIPNVTVLDPFDSQFKYLRHADLIVTENGSSGWEGLMLGRRVLTLSRTFYDGAGLAKTVLDPDRIGPMILDILSKPAVSDQDAVDHALGCMIDAETRHTFPTTVESEQIALDQLAQVLVRRLRAGAQSAVKAA
jgi:hypothetical protein